MDEENKELQGTPEAEPETQEDLQEKVNRDIAEKVSEAAEEVQEEIDEANASAEEVGEMTEQADGEPVEEEVQIPILPEVVYDAEGNPTKLQFDEEGNLLVPVYDEEGNEIQFTIPEVPEPVKEPKRVNVKVSTVVLSCIGAAIAGALILLLCLQIPKWIAAMPEGSTVATVDGRAVTDLDMKFYLYEAANEYVEKNGGVGVKKASEFDWSMPDKENAGKTAEDVVRENAINKAIQEAVSFNACEKYNTDYKQEESDKTAENQIQQLTSTYGEDIVILNCKRQGLESIKQYRRKVAQAVELQALEEDLEKNPDRYYPEDKSSLKQYVSDESVTVDLIMVNKENAGEESTRAKAEELVARIRGGESYADVVKNLDSTVGSSMDGIAVEKGSTGMDEMESAMFALDIDGVSDVIDTAQGYYIAHRTVGAAELKASWKANAKISVKENAIKKLNLKEILAAQETASDEFQAEYSKVNAGKSK